MMRYRLLAAIAAGLIATAGVLTVTAGGTPPVPPPVALRGSPSSDTTSVTTAGLEFVPPTVVELIPRAVTGGPGPADSETVGTPDGVSSAASPDDPAETSETVAPSPPATEAESADSPDTAGSPDAMESADTLSPTDSPDSPDSPDSADSPDD